MSHSDSRRPQVIESLCAALEETSGVEVGPSDAEVPFLELGLDSLFLTQFAMTAQRKFKLKITFRELQEEYPSLAKLADRIISQMPAESAPAPGAAATATPANAAPSPVAPNAPDALSTSPFALPLGAPQTFTAPQPGLPFGNNLHALIAQQLQITSQLMLMMSGGSTVTTAASAAIAPPAVPAAPPTEVTRAEASATPTVKPAAEAATPDAQAHGTKGTGMVDYDVKQAFGAIARIHSKKADPITPQQRARLDAFTRRYTDRTRKSKDFAQDNRSHMADPRVVTGFRPLTKELVYPIVVERSKGPKMWDIDGNEYVDALNGFGLNLFGWQPDFVTQAISDQLQRGHEIGPQHPLAAEVTRLLCDFTGFDRAALCNTGSEAVMGCTRIARTVTGRGKIGVFQGAYHGIFDEVLVRGTKTRSIPAAPGIMPSAMNNVVVYDWGDPKSLELIKAQADDLAAILIEPIQSRRPDFRPRDFLVELREITEKAGIVYIFDEVVTGFRLCPGGAQEYYGIRADLGAYGKVVGGGLPIGLIAGKRDFMDALDGGMWQFGDDSTPPVGVTYFAGTFVRHPLALASCRAVLLHLKEQGPKLQQNLNAKVERFVADISAFAARLKAPIEIKSFASLWRITYTSDQPYGDLLFYMMRDRGVHIWDGFPCFFTTSHQDEDFEKIAKAFKESLTELVHGEFMVGNVEGSEAEATLDPSRPPVPGARLGRDPLGKPAWFVPHPEQPTKYVKYEAANGA